MQNKSKKIVRMPKGFGVFGILLTMSFGTVLVVMLLSGRKLSSFILPGIFFLCRLLFLSVGFVWHITYDKK